MCLPAQPANAGLDAYVAILCACRASMRHRPTSMLLAGWSSTQGRTCWRQKLCSTLCLRTSMSAPACCSALRDCWIWHWVSGSGTDWFCASALLLTSRTLTVESGTCGACLCAWALAYCAAPVVCAHDWGWGVRGVNSHRSRSLPSVTESFTPALQMRIPCRRTRTPVQGQRGLRAARSCCHQQQQSSWKRCSRPSGMTCRSGICKAWRATCCALPLWRLDRRWSSRAGP